MADPIQAALKSTDRAQVLAGVAAALAAPAATVEALLSGITVATWSSRGVHELAWPGAWQCDDARHSLQQEGILRIAAGSSSPRARALV